MLQLFAIRLLVRAVSFIRIGKRFLLSNIRRQRRSHPEQTLENVNQPGAQPQPGSKPPVDERYYQQCDKQYQRADSSKHDRRLYVLGRSAATKKFKAASCPTFTPWRYRCC